MGKKKDTNNLKTSDNNHVTLYQTADDRITDLKEMEKNILSLGPVCIKYLTALDESFLKEYNRLGVEDKITLEILFGKPPTTQGIVHKLSPEKNQSSFKSVEELWFLIDSQIQMSNIATSQKSQKLPDSFLLVLLKHKIVADLLHSLNSLKPYESANHFLKILETNKEILLIPASLHGIPASFYVILASPPLHVILAKAGIWLLFNPESARCATKCPR